MPLAFFRSSAAFSKMSYSNWASANLALRSFSSASASLVLRDAATFSAFNLAISFLSSSISS